MKEGIHPEYHEIKVVLTDGSSFNTRSCYGKAGDVLQLDIDPKTHNAWTGGAGALRQTGRGQRFKERFGDLKLNS